MMMFILSYIIIFLSTKNVLCFGGHNKIYGGKPINITDAPYQVSVQLGGAMVCGGVILSPSYIATAAHCVLRTTVYYSIRAGTSDQLVGGSIHKVVNITIHPKYDDVLYDYDIALFQLDPVIAFDEGKQPILIAPRDVSDGNVDITGWGTYDDTVETSRFLQSVTIPFVNETTCNIDYTEYGGISDRMFCAGSPGFDSCLGDSGSPVVQEKQLVGLVSWANGCALKGYPGVNTKVTHPEIRSFVKEIAGV